MTAPAKTSTHHTTFSSRDKTAVDELEAIQISASSLPSHGRAQPRGLTAVPDPEAPGTEAPGPQTYRSFGWARATGPDGTIAQAWLQTGASYVFTAAASIRAVEEALSRSLCGAFSPAAAFGADFALTVEGSAQIGNLPAGSLPVKGLKRKEEK